MPGRVDAKTTPAAPAGTSPRPDGLLPRLRRRLAWYGRRFRMDNPLVGWWVERTGNRVRIDGLDFSVDNPLIRREHKSTMYFGIYEEPERAFVARYVDPGACVLELGGSIGVVSCLINRRLRDPSVHVVVEANPALIPTLTRNRDRNRCGFRVLNAAVAYGVDQVAFSSHGHFLKGSIAAADDAGATRVPTRQLGDLLRDLGRSGVVLVSDIEGAEVEMVRRDLPAIAERVSAIIMETHPTAAGVPETAEMLAALASAGFRLVESNRDVVVLLKQ